MRTIKAKHHEEEVNRRDRKARRRQALAQQQSKLQVLLLPTPLPFSTPYCVDSLMSSVHATPEAF